MRLKSLRIPLAGTKRPTSRKIGVFVFAAAAAVFGAGLAGLSPPAQAQFVCVGNATGAAVPPGTADGAGANAGGSALNVACGLNANASGNASNNTATGSFASANGDLSFNTATGSQANASGDLSFNTATGSNANASGGTSVFPSFNTATGNGAIAAGNGSANTATGNAANAGGSLSSNIATGNSANASGGGSNNIATGLLANASGSGSNNVAIGQSANASGDAMNNVAVGNLANATGANSTAIGNDAFAFFANSAAFGNGAVATSANQQMFGTASNTYTMPGITSAASAAAQSGPVQIVTSDAGGNLATSTPTGLGLASSGDISAINSRLDQLNSTSTKALNGVAMAFAMAGTPQLLPNEHFAVAPSWGNFQGTNGLSIGAAARIANNLQANAGIAYGTNGGGVGGRVGLRIGW